MEWRCQYELKYDISSLGMGVDSAVAKCLVSVSSSFDESSCRSGKCGVLLLYSAISSVNP